MAWPHMQIICQKCRLMCIHKRKKLDLLALQNAESKERPRKRLEELIVLNDTKI